MEDPQDLVLTCWHDDGNRVYRLALLDPGAGRSRTVVCGHGVKDREDAADGSRTKVETMLSNALDLNDRKDIEIR